MNPAIIAAGVGGALSLLGGERRNAAQKAASQKQMDFQERMSNTAHQRQIKDLRAAGLNPILSAKYGGASSPAGAMAQLQDTLTPAVSTAMSVMKTGADVNLKEAQTALSGVQKMLQENLVPGSEGIQKITSQINNLLGAAENLIGQSKAGYEKMLEELTLSLTDVIEKGVNAGVNATSIFIELVGERAQITQDYFNQERQK